MPLLDILRRHPARLLARPPAQSAPTEPDLARVPQVPDVDIVVAAVDEPRIKTKVRSPHRGGRRCRLGGCAGEGAGPWGRLHISDGGHVQVQGATTT